MRQNDIKGLCCDLIFQITFDLIRRLLIREPVGTVSQTIELVHAVRSANNKMPEAFQFEYLTVLCEQQAGVFFLIPNKPALPAFLMIRRNACRTGFMITVYAEDRRLILTYRSASSKGSYSAS